MLVTQMFMNMTVPGFIWIIRGYIAPLAYSFKIWCHGICIIILAATMRRRGMNNAACNALICCHWREGFLSDYEQRRTSSPSVPPSRWRGGNCHEQRMSRWIMRPTRGHNPHESLSWKAIIANFTLSFIRRMKCGRKWSWWSSLEWRTQSLMGIRRNAGV